MPCEGGLVRQGTEGGFIYLKVDELAKWRRGVKCRLVGEELGNDMFDCGQGPVSGFGVRLRCWGEGAVG